MEITSTVLVVVVILLTLIMGVVGIQLVLVLTELRKTLKRVNATLDHAESKINSVIQPFQNLGGMAMGLQTGLKVFEAFVGWLQRNRDER